MCSRRLLIMCVCVYVCFYVYAFFMHIASHMHTEQTQLLLSSTISVGQMLVEARALASRKRWTKRQHGEIASCGEQRLSGYEKINRIGERAELKRSQ